MIEWKFEWKFEDLWIGVFWKTTNYTTDDGEFPLATDIWICLLPCVPLHITVRHKGGVLHG